MSQQLVKTGDLSYHTKISVLTLTGLPGRRTRRNISDTNPKYAVFLCAVCICMWSQGVQLLTGMPDPVKKVEKSFVK